MSEVSYTCGVEAVLDLLGGKWKMLIVYHLLGSRRRFSELRLLVGDVSEKMLSQQLKEMVADGLVHRIDFQTRALHVEYELTAFGNNFSGALQPMCEWGSQNIVEITAISSARASRKRPLGTY